MWPPLEDPEGRKADLIDGAIGEASMFHATFGYYAQGVEAVTAVLPEGWENRLVRFQTEGTRDVIAWCLEPHDLWISKMIAGRPKDLEFGQALVERGIVDPAELVKRLEGVDIQDPSVSESPGRSRPGGNVTCLPDAAPPGSGSYPGTGPEGPTEGS